MAKYGQIKVTIVGYYPVSSDEIKNYGIEDFDVAEMAKVDAEEYFKHKNCHTVIDWFSEDPIVTFEAVDDSDVDMEC